jgi:hypothetical protein
MAAYTLATRYWGTSPCHNEVRFVYAPHENEWDVMWAEPDTCTIGINSLYWEPNPHEWAVEMWPTFAVTMIHEVGHLLGHEHSTDPLDVMYPEPAMKEAVTGLTLWR